MTIRVICRCGGHLFVRDDLAGQSAKCPTCGARIVVSTENSGLPGTVPAPLAPRSAHPATRESKQMATWYYTKQSKTFGPFSSTQLRQLADSGLIQPSDCVWRDGLLEWIYAGSVKGLFPDGAKQPTADQTSPTPKPRCALPPPLPPSPTPAHRVRKERPEVFEKLYNRVLTLSIPVTVATLLIDVIPVAGQVSQLCGTILWIVVSNMFLYKSWAQIQDGQARTTPGKAVGYRFIPFYLLYWEFVAIKGLATDINLYSRQRAIPVQPVSEKLSHWYCVMYILTCIPVIGVLFLIPAVVLALIQMNQVKEVSMAIAESKMAAELDAHRKSTTSPEDRSNLAAIDLLAEGLKVAGQIVIGSLHENDHKDNASE